MAAREYHCEVKSFRNLTPTVFEVAFEPNEAIEFEAGQWLSIVIPGAGPKGRDLRRAYSIASSPEMKPVELCVKLVENGPGTSFLAKLKAGDKFRAYAPYGDFVYEPAPGRDVCFIATGTGIAPFRAMMRSDEFRKSPPRSTFCLLGVRDESELLYEEELRGMIGDNYVPCVSRPCSGEWAGFCGRVTEYLRSPGSRINWSETEFYLCGAGVMIDEVKQILLEKGVAKEAIHQEIYYKTPKAGQAVT